MSKTGYRPCACRDCMEIAIGSFGAMCHECEDAGCELDAECSAPGAYGMLLCVDCGGCDPLDTNGKCVGCSDRLDAPSVRP